MPVICSRSTRLTVSIFGCIARNFGIIRLMMKPMLPASTGMHTSSRRDSVDVLAHAPSRCRRCT